MQQRPSVLKLSFAVVANTLQLPQLHCPQAAKPANLHYRHPPSKVGEIIY
jgi:hypothetical protein